MGCRFCGVCIHLSTEYIWSPCPAVQPRAALLAGLAFQAGGVAIRPAAAGREFTPKPFLRVRFAEQRESVNRIAGGLFKHFVQTKFPSPWGSPGSTD